MSRSPGLIPIGDLVGQVLKEQGVEGQVARTTVLDRWNELVGDHVARVTRAQRVSGSTLFVEVKSSPWLMELNMIRREILTRLNEAHEGDPLDNLVFVLGEGFED